MKKSSNFLELMINHNYIDKTVHQYLVKPGLSKFSREELLFLNDVYQNNSVSYYDSRYVFKDIKKVLRRIEQHHFIGEDAFFNRNFLLAIYQNNIPYFKDILVPNVLSLQENKINRILFFLIDYMQLHQDDTQSILTISKYVLQQTENKKVSFLKLFKFLFDNNEYFEDGLIYYNNEYFEDGLIVEVQKFIREFTGEKFKYIQLIVENLIIENLKKEKKLYNDIYFETEEGASYSFKKLQIEHIGFGNIEPVSSIDKNHQQEFINNLVKKIIEQNLYVFNRDNFLGLIKFEYSEFKYKDDNYILNCLYDKIKSDKQYNKLLNLIEKNISTFVNFYEQNNKYYHYVTNEYNNFIEIINLIGEPDSVAMGEFLQNVSPNIICDYIIDLNEKYKSFDDFYNDNVTNMSLIFSLQMTKGNPTEDNVLKEYIIKIINKVTIINCEKFERALQFDMFSEDDLNDINNKEVKKYLEKKLKNSEETQHDSKT